jgi:hypothetical protein
MKYAEKKCLINFFNKRNKEKRVFFPLGGTQLSGLLIVLKKIPLGKTQSNGHLIVKIIEKIKSGFFPLGTDKIEWLPNCL